MSKVVHKQENTLCGDPWRVHIGVNKFHYWISEVRKKFNNNKIVMNSHVQSRKQTRNGILLPKLFWPTVRKNCSSDRENVLITGESNFDERNGQL